MNPRMLLVVVLAITLKANVFAQPILEDLKLNENIKWLAVAYRDFDFRSTGPQSSFSYEDGASQNKLLKYKVEPPVLTQPHIQNFDIHNDIMDYLQDQEVHTDEELNHPVLDKEERSNLRGKVEIIETFDSETFETIKTEVVQEYSSDEIAFMRVKYIIYLNEEEEFIIIPLSFAPLYVRDEGGQTIKTPICWLPIVVHQERTDIDSPTIPWMMRSIFPLFRGTTEINAESEKIDFAQAAQNVVIDIQESEDEGNLVSWTGVQTMKSTLDGYSGEGIKDLVLIQDWWWDDETKTLHSLYLGFGLVTPTSEPTIKGSQEGVFIYKMLKE